MQQEPDPKRIRRAKLYDQSSDEAKEVVDAVADISVAPSKPGIFFKKRHQHFYDLLKEELTESPGKEVCQDEVLRILKLGTKPEDKRIATKAVRDTFATAQVSHRKHVYKNVRRSLPYQLDDDGEINQPQQGYDIASLKNKIKISSDQISAWQKEIQEILLQLTMLIHIIYK